MPDLRSSLDGKIISLGTPWLIHSGGEGQIYRLPYDSTMAAKIYHKPTRERSAKLEFMLSNAPTDPTASIGHRSIAWPVDLLCTTAGQPQIVGFLMHYVDNMHPVMEFYSTKTRLRVSPRFNYGYLLRTARNMAAAFHALHMRGYVVGDVNESNVLVADTALVTLVDTDSFQITNSQTGKVWRCPVGKSEFTCAELQGYRFSTVDRGIHHDLFGLSVLVFMLLMEGNHPFKGRYNGTGDPPPIEERISCGAFPYGSKRPPLYSPPRTAPDYSMLDPLLHDLFARCFVEGHENPDARPKASEWLRRLTEAEGNLVECGQNSQHLYGRHLRTCPWCERTRTLGGLDPFPARQVPVQVPLRRPHVPPPVSAVRCQQCGESNAYDQLYCKKCLGFLDPVRCANPDCRADNPRRASYCGYCGSKR